MKWHTYDYELLYTVLHQTFGTVDVDTKWTKSRLPKDAALRDKYREVISKLSHLFSAMYPEGCASSAIEAQVAWAMTKQPVIKTGHIGVFRRNKRAALVSGFITDDYVFYNYKVGA